jgi:hypothetical protein
MRPEEFVLLETDEELLAAVDCGFELETQRFDGISWCQTDSVCQNDKPDNVDWKEWTRALDKLCVEAQQDPVWLIACLEDPARNPRKHLNSAVLRLAQNMGCPVKSTIENPELAVQWAKDMYEAGHSFSYSDLIILPFQSTAILEAWNEWFKAHSVDIKRFTKSFPYKDTTELLQLPPDLVAIKDNTVEGPEIVTKHLTKGYRGITAERFLELAEYCFSRNPVIDRHCSFHVNLSLSFTGPDKISECITFEPWMQRAMQEYLLYCKSEWPECIKERVSDKQWMEEYCAPGNDYNKYRIVAFRMVRWEFRLWGNVKTVADAKQCLLLSIRAMQHAYRARLGLEPMLTTGNDELKKQWRNAV